MTSQPGGRFDTAFVAWGDSLTAGANSTGAHDYPSQLAMLWQIHTPINAGAGAETSTQIKARMLADTLHRGTPTIIWAGRNNYTDPPTVEADIASMVASLTTTKYIVLSVLNGTAEVSGNSGYNNIITINTYLAATYGSHYIDVRAYLVSLWNPSIPQDVIDHGNDIPPSTLRSDAIHLNNAGYAAVANKIYQSISVLTN